MKRLLVCALLLACSLAWAGDGVVTIERVSDSCCADRAVLAKGVQGAVRELRDGHVESALRILEATATATGVPVE